MSDIKDIKQIKQWIHEDVLAMSVADFQQEVDEVWMGSNGSKEIRAVIDDLVNVRLDFEKV